MSVQDTQQIGSNLVALCNDGKGGEAIEILYEEKIGSIEGQESDEIPARMDGIDAIRGKNEWWSEHHEVHSSIAAGPIAGIARNSSW